MIRPNPTSPLDAHREFVSERVAQGLSYSYIIAELKHRGVVSSERSIRRALYRWNPRAAQAPRSTAERPGYTLKGDEATVTGRPSRVLNTPEELLEERGLDPEEWDVKTLTVNEWDSMTSDKKTGDNEVVTMKQLKIVVVRRKPYNFILPAVDGPSYRHERLHVKLNREAKLVVIVGDQQAPYQDPKLHDLFCQWLEFNQPDKGVLTGDTIDLPDISRHPDNPEWHVETQKSVNSGYLLLRDYVQAATATEWDKLMGNHDERIRVALLKYLAKLWGLRPADIPGEDPQRPVWDIRNLLHLDSLGINLVEPKGKYTHALHKVTDKVAVLHGDRASKGAGTSVRSTMEERDYSVIMGHTHRQALVHRTTHDINGQPFTLAAVETGCMCRIEGGLGYVPAPDWQNGFVTATTWPDGSFKLDLATYVDGNLYWRDQRY